MAPPSVTFHLMCIFLLSIALKLSLSLRQDSGFLSANVGDSVTLKCFYEGDASTRFFWYKQTLGQKPLLISSFFKYYENAIFHDEFKNDPRFKVEIETNGTQLKISVLRHSDSATYFCVGSSNFEFGDGVTLSVNGSGLNIQAVVHQSESQTIQPGDSVTLNCTVHTGTCDGEHSVYWFRSSGHSQPRAIYTHGVTDDQCERKPTTHTQACDYNLPMKSLDLSDAGTYYCAVLSCGEILFGNGTKIDIENEVASPPVLVYFLSAALAFTITLVVLLASSVYKMHKRNCSHSTDSQARSSTASIQHVEGQDADNLHYAALSVNKAHRPRRQRDNRDPVCVYSSIKQ
ncbi:immunoglobulin kappa light chain-like [Myripristis murdjan]|uniref:immunoglobulin kappa light chain-like n=1 Tax=Myripristis murdjan TaxID=586833 RepID=UPI001175CFFD|nr:immunoglobulin kappa light chain-like [Myripristis murdjan]